MPTPGPDRETVRAALSLAVRAPSIHNSQPWHWRVGHNTLQLYADHTLHLPHTDPGARELLISCGAALNHCVIASAALGWRAEIHRFPNDADPWHLAAVEMHRQSPHEVDIALAAAIPRRRTDRRLYSAWPVAAGDIALIGARAARAGVMMRRVEATSELRSAVASAVRQHAADHGYRAELATWSGRHAWTSGVPAASVPASVAESPVPGRVFAGAALDQPPGADPAEDNAVLLALGTAADDGLARLRAGEATSLALLTATALGLATCPVTEPLEIPATRDAVRREVFEESGLPQLLFRVGWAPVNADPLPPTPRRPLAEVVSRLDGSPWE
ncbi:Acg family FMN-binding oxidoreductase [Mycolicibacterium doricum]|uniref:NAD(P)H nitroreductase n=1 Tax=Mycolicibacterium doricum TaxID=126673 RepID=A0A1X1T021_9MYCO|nr:NAD(P)H nitroreductase [Mycolicibacterium doricum]MCV7268290.1 NAD(P)H nitroreductase [Mycolicibacterium doricum]ORV37487.1 NAD(P)H nitroreductase [Mycolicibacterium doricum]